MINMGGRKQASCEHGIHVLLEKIHFAWKQNKVASMLLMDVSGAFDNVAHERLLHNMRKRGLPQVVVEWMRSYFTGRRTKIRIAEGTSAGFGVDTGIPQGSPLSPILYLFYNADLLEVAGLSVLTTGYIDDTSVVVVGDLIEENIIKLQQIHCRMELWA